MLVPNVVNLDICSFVMNFKKHSGYCVWWILAMGLLDLWDIADLHWRKVKSTKRVKNSNFGLNQTVCPAAPLGLLQSPLASSQSMSNLIVQNLQACHLASYIKICKTKKQTKQTYLQCATGGMAPAKLAA